MRAIPDTNSAWRHFALLLILGVAFVFVGYLTTSASHANGWAMAVVETARHLPEVTFLVVPAAAGIAIGTLRMVSGSLSVARRMLLVSTLLTLTLVALRVVMSYPQSELTTLLTSGARPPATVQGQIPQYPRDHPRILAISLVRDVSMLVMPFVLIGVVLGLGTWIRDRVRFRSSSDEFVAQWFIALVVVPLVLGTVTSWSGSYEWRILFGGAPLLLLWVPYLPAGVVAVVGWRAAARAVGQQHALRAPASA